MLQSLVRVLCRSKPYSPYLPISRGVSLPFLRSACSAVEDRTHDNTKYHFGVVGSGPAGFYTANLVSDSTLRQISPMKARPGNMPLSRLQLRHGVGIAASQEVWTAGNN